MRETLMALLLCLFATSAQAQCDGESTPSLEGVPFEPPAIPESAASTIARADEILALSGEAGSRPRHLLELANAYLAENQTQEAIRVLAILLRDHEGGPNRPLVLFQLAYSLERLDQVDRARAVYFQLIRSHPQSEFVQAAYLAFAIRYARERDWSAAIQFALRVSELDGRWTAWGHYLRAWAEAAQGNPHYEVSLSVARRATHSGRTLEHASLRRLIEQEAETLHRLAACPRP